MTKCHSRNVIAVLEFLYSSEVIRIHFLFMQYTDNRCNTNVVSQKKILYIYRQFILCPRIFFSHAWFFIESDLNVYKVNQKIRVLLALVLLFE